MIIFETDKWSSHFVKRNTFQNLSYVEVEA